MRNYAMIEENNKKRNYKLVNVSQGINLIPFLHPENISYSKFQKTIDGNIAPNTLNFTLRFPYSQKIVEAEAEKYMYIDSDLIKDLLIDNTVGDLDNFIYKGTINIVDLIKENHEFYFYEEYNGQEIFAFTGVIDFDSFSTERDKLYLYMNITLKDKTSVFRRKKYVKDYLFQNMYLSNNADKANSLYHQLAYLMGLLDSEIDIDDVKDGIDFVRIPLVYLKKDDEIVKDLAEAVRLVNTVYTFENNKLSIKVNRPTETYQFTKVNTLSKMSIKPILAQYDKLKVTYDRYFQKQKQMMWALVGENGNPDSANILVRANTPRTFKVDWFYEVDFIGEYEAYEIVFTDINGNSLTPNYTLDITGTGGTLTITPGANDVYVKSFKIKGVPMWCQGDNTSYYPSNVESERVQTLTNKFIQNETLALLHQKIYYEEYCRKYKEFNFTTNVAHFLAPGIKIYLDHEDYTGYVEIDTINFNTDKMTIKAYEYIEPYPLQSFTYLEQSQVDEAEVKSKSVLQDLGLYEKDKPPVPTNMVLEAMPLGFAITFDRPTNVSLRGHYIYIKKQSDVDWKKVFANTNYYFYQTTQLVIYEVKVANVSINGVEGDPTEVKGVTPLLVENNVIDYQEGLSPAELDQKVQNINTVISQITEGIDTHGINIELIETTNTYQNQKIEVIENDIVSMKQKDTDNYTAIQQNAEQIQSIAQKTTANENTISQHSTAITQNANSIQSVAQELDNANTAITQNANAITATAQTASGAMSKATQNAENITSLVAKTDGHATQINQNAEEIESIAQKTTANENAITQQGTAITQNANAIESIAQEVETKTTATEVETITNTAIESFSANEFRRTLGTRVSIIDYSKNIDEVENLNIDSAELEEVMIEDYYSSIYQNARMILSLVKSSDEQYSSIMQLVDNITLLVQEDENAKSLIQQLSDSITALVQKDDDNYSLIEQLTDELTTVVRKDSLVSSINQTAEEIKINAQRIALGSGLVVEDDKVAVKSVFGLNFGLGIGVLGNQDGLILQSDNFRLYANTTTGDFDLLATGNIEFKNAKNRIYLDKENGLSQIILKANWSNNGVMLPEFEGVDFQIGEVGSSKGYFKFDDDEGVSMDIKNLKIDGNSILNYLSYKAEAGLSASSKYATRGMCKEFFGVTTFNSGWYIVKEKDGVSTTGQISYTDVVCNLYNVAPTRDIFSYDIDELSNSSKKVVINTLVGSSRNEYKIYVSDFATSSTCTLLYSSPSPISASGFIDAYDNYSKMFILNDKIYYQILIIESGSTLTLKTYSLSFAGVNTLLDSQTTTSTLDNFKIIAFKKDNFIYFIQNNNLYKTQDFITNTLVHSETELSGYTLVGNEIFKTKNNYKGKLWKISETNPATEYNTPSDYSTIVKGGKYYYFIADTHFYISLDLLTYKKIFKEDYNTLIYPQSHRTVIMKKQTDSTACDPYTMTGYTFGTLDW